jgi:flagellar hook-associated protein 2
VSDDADSNFLTAIGLTASSSTPATVAQGKDAEIVVNGTSKSFTSNSINIDGTTIKLNAVTPVTGGSVSITVTRDTAPTVEKVKEFVTAYNELVGKLTGLLKESKTAKQRSYEPLTAAEKEGMSEDEITAWENTAKIGLLHNDAGLNSVLNSLRTSLYAVVGDTGLSPASVGLGTYSFNEGGVGDKAGQINLDVNKLTAALEADPEAVTKMFTSAAITTALPDGVAKIGFLPGLRNAFSTYEANYRSEASLNITERIRDQAERVSTLETKLATLAENYYKRFAAMETALAKIQASADQFTSMLGE